MSDELIERWESAVKHYNRRFIDNGVESIAIRKSLIDDTISRIESLQAKVEELERGMKFWQERSADRQKTLDLCANQQLKLEARLAKYETGEQEKP